MNPHALTTVRPIGRPVGRATQRDELTEHQTRILDRLCEIGCGKALAYELGVSAQHIARQMDDIKDKAGIANRTLLLLWWDRQKRGEGPAV